MSEYGKQRFCSLLIISSILIFVLAGCVGDGPPGSIEGYVSITPAAGDAGRDLVITPSEPGNSGNMPLSGAVAAVDGTRRTATTSVDGAFRIDGLPQGDYVVTVTHDTVRDPISQRVRVYAGKVSQVAETVMGRGYYLFVGINDYAYITDLQGPENDVQYVSAALSRAFVGAAKRLVGRDATKDGIKRAIADIASAMNPNDFFVLYYSGHGGKDGYFPGKDFICPYDTSIGDPATIVTDGELADWLSAVPGGKVTVILDSCNSGAFADGNATRSLSPTDLGAAKSITPPVMPALRRNGVVLLAASKGDQLAWERDGHGIFTNTLVAGIGTYYTDADTDGDRVLTTRELFLFSVNEIRREVSGQDPQMWPDPRTNEYKYFQGPPVLRY